MSLGLLGTKLGMTQVYTEDGTIAPVTVLQVGPCPVLQVRVPEANGRRKDGYHAVQVGYKNKFKDAETARRKATRAEAGHVTAKLTSKRRTRNTRPLDPKAEVEPQRHIREFRLSGPATVQVGELLTVEKIFGGPGKVKDAEGNEKDGIVITIKRVDVVGTSKGRGYTGVMKRHNFKGLRTSHGVKKGSRQRGSIASNASNRGSGRPKKGIRMAGQYGNTQVTARNLQVVKFDAENHLLLVRGAVPGPTGGFIIVRPTRKKTRAPSAQPQQTKKKK
jgi:large subunit ribosomal protein L3